MNPHSLLKWKLCVCWTHSENIFAFLLLWVYLQIRSFIYCLNLLFQPRAISMMKEYLLLLKTLLVFLSCKHQWWKFVSPCNQTPDNACLLFSRPNIQPLLLQDIIFLPSHTWTLIFWSIVHVVNTIFHVHFPILVSWKRNIVFIELTCCRWTINFLNMDFNKKYKLGWCQGRKLVFVIVERNMPYLHLLPFL